MNTKCKFCHKPFLKFDSVEVLNDGTLAHKNCVRDYFMKMDVKK
jgi:hypothetical protein